MLPRWSATGAGLLTIFIGPTASGHSGKSPTVVGEAWRRRIRKFSANGERTGDIAHLKARRSISLFIRLVKHYFRFFFVNGSPWRAPLLTVSPWIPRLLVKLRRQLPPWPSRGILNVRENRRRHV